MLSVDTLKVMWLVIPLFSDAARLLAAGFNFPSTSHRSADAERLPPDRPGGGSVVGRASVVAVPKALSKIALPKNVLSILLLTPVMPLSLSLPVQSSAGRRLDRLQTRTESREMIMVFLTS